MGLINWQRERPRRVVCGKSVRLLVNGGGQGTSIEQRQLFSVGENARQGPHPGGNPRANLKSISHRCHPILVAFVWELTKETIHFPLGCLQGGSGFALGEERPLVNAAMEDSLCMARVRVLSKVSVVSHWGKPLVNAAMDDSLCMARLHVLSIFSCAGRTGVGATHSLSHLRKGCR